MRGCDSQSIDAQVGYLFKNTEHQPPAWLRELLADSARFQEFVSVYRDKIRKKISGSRNREDVNDVLAELRVACLLLLDDRIELAYEKYGSRVRAPDLTATFLKSVQLNIEVARIRRAEVDVRFDAWYRELRRRVGITTIDWMVSLEEPEASLDLIERLEQLIEPITLFIKEATQETRPVKGFEKELRLTVFRRRCEPDIDSYVRTRPIVYTQRENRKFGDIIVAKLRQLRSSMINVLFILSDSISHDTTDFDMGRESLFRALSEGDEAIREKILKEFASIEDFDAHLVRLSGIVFRSMDEYSVSNVLWCNPSAANPIPEVLGCYLRSIDHPRA